MSGPSFSSVPPSVVFSQVNSTSPNLKFVGSALIPVPSSVTGNAFALNARAWAPAAARPAIARAAIELAINALDLLIVLYSLDSDTPARLDCEQLFLSNQGTICVDRLTQAEALDVH
jgi:hypothetical protein